MTATHTYEQLRREITILLQAIQGQVNAHADNQAKHPTDWGYVGDLGRAADQLREVIKGLS